MTFLAYLLGLAVLGWALMPLFKKDSTWVSLHMEGEELEDRKQRVYGNIADLEFDYAMGRLSESDFSEIRLSFMSEAGKVIEKIESQRSAEIIERIESELKGGTKKKKSSQKKPAYCPACGEPVKANDKFCAACGEGLVR